MRITRVLRSDCPSGIDCDRIYDTDGDDLAVQGRTVDDSISPSESGGPPGTAVVLVARTLLPDAEPVALGDEEISSADNEDVAIRGRVVSDAASLGIRTPPHESVLLVRRALLPCLAVAVSAADRWR